MDVRGVAQQEAAAIAKARGAAVADPVSRKPATGLEGQPGSRLLADRGDHVVEIQVFFPAQGGRHDPHDSPVVGPPHREEQVESPAPQVHVDLVRRHRSRHLRIGHEEHVLVGRALERDPAQIAHGAVRAVATRDPGGRDLPARAVLLIERGLDAIRLLRQGGELRVPLDGNASLTENLAKEPLVIVLSEDQEVRVRTQTLPDVAQQDVRRQAPSRPEVGADRALAEGDRLLGDAQMRIDLESARLHAQGARLPRRSVVPVDDRHAHAAPGELVGQHQSRRAGPDHQNFGVHGRSLKTNQCRADGCLARTRSVTRG